MEIIGIADFERLVYERLSNPKAYANRTLLLWNGDYTTDSIEYDVITQCTLNYNKSYPYDQVWFSYSDLNFQDDDYSKNRAFCDHKEMYGCKPLRILFNTGCFFDKDEVVNWIKFVNTRTNNKGQLPNNCVLIACVQAKSSCNFREDQFLDNCDIVCLKPSIEEWSKWMSSRCDSETLKCVLSFIKSTGREPDYLYLGRIISSLESELADRNLQFVGQLSKDDFNLAVGGIAPSFPRHDFWNFIQTYNKSDRHE